MKKIIALSLLIFGFLCATPALATALKSLDSVLIPDLRPNFLETEPINLIILGFFLLSIAGFSRHVTKK